MPTGSRRRAPRPRWRRTRGAAVGSLVRLSVRLPHFGDREQQHDWQRHGADGELRQRHVWRLEDEEQDRQQHAVGAQRQYLADPVPGADHDGRAGRDEDKDDDLEGVHGGDGDHRGSLARCCRGWRQSPWSRTRIARIVACERNGAAAIMKTSATIVSPVFSSRPSATKIASVTKTGATTTAGVT